MSKWQKIFLIIAVIAFLILYLGNRFLNSGSTMPDNTVWIDYLANDTTVGLWPDRYANYFAYTFVRTKADLGLRISGEFPDTRYMSFNVYNLQDKSTQGSIIDADIIASQDFEIDNKIKGDSFNIHVIPEQFDNIDLLNKLTFENRGKFLLVVMRLYDFNQDKYGGTALPNVQAIDLSKADIQESINLPRSLNLRRFVNGPKIAEDIWFMYEAENIEAMDGPSQQQQYFKLPFFRVIGEGMIQNNDNLYLLSAVTKKEDEVYVLKFKSPTFVQQTTDIGQTDVRYWSVNIGDDISYDFNAIKDEDCKIDSNGYVTVVIGTPNPELENLVDDLDFNFLEWNVPRDKGFLIYRNMLTSTEFTGHFLGVPPLKDQENLDFSAFEAKNFIGPYAPIGIRMSQEEFIKEFRTGDLSI